MKAGHRVPVSSRPGRGSSHSLPMKEGHQAPVSGWPRRRIVSLTSYESRSSSPSAAGQDGEPDHSLPMKAGHRAPVSTGHGGGPGHSLPMKADHQAPVSGRPSGRDRVTYILRKQVIGCPSVAGQGRRYRVTHILRAGHRAPVSGRPRRGIESLTSYESRSSAPISGRPSRGTG